MLDELDNCPTIPNSDQADSDFDGIGDRCTFARTHSTAGFITAGLNGGSLVVATPLSLLDAPTLLEKLVRIVDFRLRAGLTGSAAELTQNLVNSQVALGFVPAAQADEFVTDVLRRVENTAPVVTPILSTLPNSAGWHNQAVTVSWNVSDPESGIASSSGCGITTLTADTAGVTLTCTATNGVGLTSSVPVTIKIDTTSPTIVGARTEPNINGWNNTDVIVSYTANDNPPGSGLDSPSTGSFTFTSEGSDQSHTFTVKDVAGNQASVTIGNVKIDKTPPEAYLSFYVPTFDIALFGRDALSTVPPGPLTPRAVVPTTWPGPIDPEIGPTLAALRLAYDVTDLAGNVTRYQALVQPHTDDDDTDPGTHATRGMLINWQYGTGTSIGAPGNSVRFEWRNNNTRIFTKLAESTKITHVKNVKASWDANIGATEITILVPLPRQTFTVPGLSLLRLSTAAGALKVEFDVP